MSKTYTTHILYKAEPGVYICDFLEEVLQSVVCNGYDGAAFLFSGTVVDFSRSDTVRKMHERWYKRWEENRR